MKYSDKANTAIGSTAAVVSAATAAGVISLGPIVGPAVAIAGVGVATGALVYKLVHEKPKRSAPISNAGLPFKGRKPKDQD